MINMSFSLEQSARILLVEQAYELEVLLQAANFSGEVLPVRLGCGIVLVSRPKIHLRKLSGQLGTL
jgi:hypothetical protein